METCSTCIVDVNLGHFLRDVLLSPLFDKWNRFCVTVHNKNTNGVAFSTLGIFQISLYCFSSSPTSMTPRVRRLPGTVLRYNASIVVLITWKTVDCRWRWQALDRFNIRDVPTLKITHCSEHYHHHASIGFSIMIILWFWSNTENFSFKNFRQFSSNFT